MVLTTAFINIQIYAEWNISYPSNLLYGGTANDVLLNLAQPRQRASDLEELSGRVPGRRRAGVTRGRREVAWKSALNDYLSLQERYIGYK